MPSAIGKMFDRLFGDRNHDKAMEALDLAERMVKVEERKAAALEALATRGCACNNKEVKDIV